jgi:hypothetical protein
LKFEGFVDMINGTFIDEISELLQSSNASNAKGKSIFAVDHTRETLAGNIEKNFNDVSTFLKFLRASVRHVMTCLLKIPWRLV